jgi:glycosyltransferase involved in cell wall biosynthesis
MSSPLRILHFSTADTTGGAAQAAYRLHLALEGAGHDSSMIVRQKTSGSADVEEVQPYLPRWRGRLRRLRRALHVPQEDLSSPPPAFNLDVTPDIRRDRFYARHGIDVIVLHSITRLLTVAEIRQIHDHYGVPIVWQLADQAPLTGGCHYSYDCDGYTHRCGRCPQLASERDDDRSRTVWNRKQDQLSELPIVFVAASSPAAEWVRASSVFGHHRVERIPCITDTRVFRPTDRNAARDLLDVPRDARVVLLGAGALLHPRKGVATFAPPALTALRDLGERDVFVLAVGGGGAELLPQLPFPGRALGMLHDDLAIALAYQAADVYLCPSIADAGPLMVPESLLCGTPVVAFDVGYAVDLVRDGETGALIRSRAPGDLALGLREVLARDRGSWRDACRDVALHHAPEAVADAHIRLYRELVAPSRG